MSCYWLLNIFIATTMVLFSGCAMKEESNVSLIEIEPVAEMSFFDSHIILPINKTVEFSGNYYEAGPNGSSIDVFILQDNNTVKWNHLFLNKRLDVLPGEYVCITGTVLKNDVYGYAQFVQVENFTEIDIEIDEEIFDKCNDSIKLKSKILSEQSLTEIAKWDKESLDDYFLNVDYFSNVSVYQSFIDFDNQKIIISYEGARIPPFEDILNRRVYIYCIWDIKYQEVEKLILTIQGEVLE